VAKRKKRKKRASRLPLFLLVLLMAGVGGLVVVAANQTSNTTGTPTPVDTTPSGDNPGSAPSDTSAQSSDTVGTVAPPVTVHIETDDSHDQGGAVLEDYTAVDPPEVPEATAALKSSWLKNGYFTAALPDGYYWAYVESSADEPERTITFDLRQTYWGAESCRAKFGDGPEACLDDYGVDDSVKGLLKAPVADMIFVSLPTLVSNESGSRSITPANWWPLVNTNLATVNIPDEDVEAVVNGPYLLTIIDGKVVAAEGIRVP
jgi:hypothetical protein